MKKIILVLMGAMILSSFLVIAENSNSENRAEIQEEHQGDVEGNLISQNMEQERVRVQDGEYRVFNGEKIEVKEMDQKRIQIKIQNKTMNCDCNLSQDGNKLRIHLSNGNNAEIKIMPETASEIAMERLKLKDCNSENNCSIELREVGKGNLARAVYEVQVQKQAKIFGLFRTQVRVQTQVDVESGEVVQVQKPWWAVLSD